MEVESRFISKYIRYPEESAAHGRSRWASLGKRYLVFSVGNWVLRVIHCNEALRPANNQQDLQRLFVVGPSTKTTSGVPEWGALAFFPSLIKLLARLVSKIHSHIALTSSSRSRRFPLQDPKETSKLGPESSYTMSSDFARRKNRPRKICWTITGPENF